MRNSLIDMIKSCTIFSMLEREVCEKIVDLFEPIELKQDDILFKQGDSSHCLYIVTQGTLSAIAQTLSGDKYIGSIEKGETVGEMGAISGEARTLTIKAAQETQLLRLSSKEFIKLCHQYPTILLETIKPIISRSQKNIKLLSSENECNYVGVIYQNKSIPVNKIVKYFLKNIPKNSDYIFICDSEIESKNIEGILKENRKKYSTIIVLLDSGNSELSKIILDKCQTLYVMVDAELNYELDPFSRSIIYGEEYKNKIKFELILLHSLEKKFPRNTKKWLEKEVFFQHHHLRVNNDIDYQRLLRFFTGNAVGLVLGGGGTRGWLHLGVLKGLLEAKIPIDAIGGTSVGSCVGGAYLFSEESYKDTVDAAKTFMKTAGPPFGLKDLTLPMISFLSSERITNSLATIFSDHLIEDLWLPYYCVSSNLSTYKEQIHHSGLLHQKIRASIAIPGILPPMVIDGQLHYDGALCNNLPVDIMRNIVGINGKIIAVGLTSFYDKNKEYDFPPILTFKDIASRKLNIGKQSYKFPPFFDTFYSVLTFGSYQKEKENGAFSDILINPDINNYGMLNVKKHQEKELIRIGYHLIEKALVNWEFDISRNKLVKK